MNYIQQQIEWFKSFFSETYTNGIAGKASTRRIIELGVTGVFISMCYKIVVGMLIVGTGPWIIPDIPSGWYIVLLGILGLRTSQNITTIRTNGKGSKDTTPTNPISDTVNNLIPPDSK